MPKYSDFTAAIFDVDDTLLDNFPSGHPNGLHEESRLLAVHDVGKRRDIPGLAHITTQQNIDAFRYAPIHSLESAVWRVMQMAGVVHADDIDTANPIFLEIVRLKEEWHEHALRSYAQEVPGAAAFVRSLAEHGFKDKLAIASTAYRRDIFIALELLGIADLFPDNRIFSKDRFTHAKPHPEVFELAFQSLGLDIPKGKVLAFEDDPRGVMSAKAAGLYTCAITTRYGKEYLEKHVVSPDLIANSYTEFASLLGL